MPQPFDRPSHRRATQTQGRWAHGRSIWRRLPLLLAWAMGLAHAQVYLVVSTANPLRSLTRHEVLDLYMGRTQVYPTGEFALLFDLPFDHPQRQVFYKALTGYSPAQLNSYWSRLMFTGQVAPPHRLPSEAVVQDMVRRNPSAIGYLAHEPAGKGLRVVLVLPENER